MNTLKKWYEDRKLYVLNWCDMDAHKWLKSLGKAFQLLASECQCCSGVRVLLTAAVAAVWPPAILFIIGIVLLAWGWHAIKDLKESQS